MTPQEFLLRVKLTLIKRGWTKGKYEQENGQVCLVGAINTVLRETDEDYDGDGPRLARHHLYATTSTGNIEGWNDEPGRTEADVHAAVDAALIRSRS